MGVKTNLGASEALIEAFCRSLTSCGKSPQTVKDRRGDLSALVRWSETWNEGQFDLNKFVAKEFEPYRTWLLTEFKDSTVNRRLTSLNLFLNWCVRKGLLESHALPIIKSVKRKPISISKRSFLVGPDLLRLFEEAKRSKDLTEIAMMALLIGAGLRISDICPLRWEDVDLKSSLATVTIARTQFGHRVRIPLYDPVVRQALLSLEKSKSCTNKDLIFQRGPHRWTRRSVEMLIKRYAKLAGLPLITPKTLRYSFITRLVEMGFGPQQVAMSLGSARIDSIGRYYNHGVDSLSFFRSA